MKRLAAVGAKRSEIGPSVSLAALFAGFFRIGMIGFGGVLPWARRMLVEQRKWLTAQEFTDLLALCQFLPGPNVVNLAAKLIAIDPSLTPQETIALIKQGADNSADGRRNLINPKATMALLKDRKVATSAR